VPGHPVAGPYTSTGWPAPVGNQPFELHRHALALGEHTAEILSGIGYSAERIAALREDGVTSTVGRTRS